MTFEYLVNLGLAFLLALVPTIFWLAFYFKFSKKFTTPRGKLFKVFVYGLMIAGPVGVIEIFILSKFPQDFLFLFSSGQVLNTVSITDVLIMFGVMFFLIAPLEEGVKYIILKKTIHGSSTLDQVIDGIKYGVVIGLGFATIENAYYFWQEIPIVDYTQFALLFSTRLLIATLAHSLYGGIAGYYLALARFHKTYKKEFMVKGFLTVVLIHGVFNFAFFLQQTFFAVAMITVSVIFVMKWYQDRVHFQSKTGPELVGSYLPFLPEKHEVESILYKNNVTYSLLKKLNFCPFCLKRKKTKDDYCHYCGQRLG